MRWVIIMDKLKEWKEKIIERYFDVIEYDENGKIIERHQEEEKESKES